MRNVKLSEQEKRDLEQGLRDAVKQWRSGR